MTSTTQGYPFLFGALLLEAGELGVLSLEVNPLQDLRDLKTAPDVRSNDALIEKGTRSIEMKLSRTSGNTGLVLMIVENGLMIMSVGSPGVRASGRLCNVWEIQVVRSRFTDWFRQACCASAMEDFYFGNQQDLLQLLPETERSDPRSPLMGCFLLNILKELAR